MHSLSVVVIFTLILMYQKVCGRTEVVSVSTGDNVRLQCSVKHEKQTLWFGQRPNNVPFLSISASRKTQATSDLFTQFITDADLRFNVAFHAAAGSVYLMIENVTESDQALYYCASMKRGNLCLGNGTRVVISGEEGEDDTGLHVQDHCVPCRVHLAFVSLVCVTVCTFGLCCCCQRVLKKKKKNPKKATEDRGLQLGRRQSHRLET